MFDNRNVFDFKAVQSIEGGNHLSLVWQHAWDGADHGSGIILDNSYTIQKQITYPSEFGAFDIHEFNTLDDGNTSLAISYRGHTTPMDDLGRPGEVTNVFSGGFTEIDLSKGEVVRDWDSFDQIALSETVQYSAASPPDAPPNGWDYVHANSVDKNADGDYIMSFRFTNTVYMIDGETNQIKWRLRGEKERSDFDQDFVFSKQHDAKFLESNGTHHVISIMNNASDEYSNDEELSSILIIELDTGVTPMTARLLRRYNRPDGKLTRLRGNAQILPNKNVFGGWSNQGYITEQTEDGEVLLSANFVSTRFSTYRAYKFEFTGRPSAPPDLVARVWGNDAKHLTTTFYVSWNGATDVAWWNFYAQASELGHAVFVGSVPRRDFETMFIAKGYLDWVSVEAVDDDGNVLGTSEVHRSETPSHWKEAGLDGDVSPSDPIAIYSLDSSPSGQEIEEENDADADDDDASSSAMQVSKVDTAELSRVAHETYFIVRSMGRLVVFVLILASLCGIGVGMYKVLRRRRSRTRSTYRQVPRKDDLDLDIPEEEIRLHSG